MANPVIQVLIGVLGSLGAAALIWFGSRYIVRAWHHVKKRFSRGTLVVITPTWNLDAVHALMARATQRVLILQTWFPEWKRELRTWELLMSNRRSLTSAHSPPFQMKVLLLDPTMYHARLRARDVRLETRNLSLAGIDMFSTAREAEIKSFVASNSTPSCTVEVALYNSLPFGPIYIIDDSVHWGLFVSDKDSMDSLCFASPVGSQIGKVVLESFEKAWASRSSQIHPARNLGEESSHRWHVCSRFNALREKLRDLRLLGTIAPSSDDQEAEVDQDFLSCLDMCLEGTVRTVVMLRHAETELNQAGVFSGLLPLRLSDGGEKQLHRLLEVAPFLGRPVWTTVLCSTLERTHQTLEGLLGRSSKILPCRELDERNIGRWEGSRKVVKGAREKELKDRWRFFSEPPLGESYARLLLKLDQSNFIQDVLCAKPGHQKTLICAHEGPLKLFRMLIEAEKELKPDDMDAIESIEIHNAAVLAYVDMSSLALNHENAKLVDACIAKAADKVTPKSLRG